MHVLTIKLDTYTDGGLGQVLPYYVTV